MAMRLDRRWWILLGFCLLLVLLQSWGQTGRLLLRYERQGIADGESWRLVSGHLVHLGWSHLMLNLTGLVLLWSLFATEYRARQWALIGVFSVIAIDVGFWWFEPQLHWYVGLSGVLHGALAAGVRGAVQRGEPGAWALAAVLIGKMVWEQAAGPMPLSVASAGGAVVVDAHLYGALGGAVGAAIIGRRFDSWGEGKNR